MIVFTVNGVLRDAKSGSFIPSGAALFRSLTEQTSTALVAPDDLSSEALTHWLAVNNITTHQYLLRPRETDAEDEGQARVEQLSRLRQSGSIDLLIEADPWVATAVLREGIPVMLFCAPAYARPEHLPGERRLPTAWAVLVGEIDRQQSIKASDARIAAETV